MPERRPFLEVDATAHFQKDLDEKLNQLYPPITKRGEANYQRFIRRELNFCSFKVFGVEDQVLTRKLLCSSLERATNPQPHAEAIRIIKEENSPESRTKRLRKLSQEKGVPYTLLVATYMGLDTNDILNIFDSKDVRKNIQEKHGKVSIPHHGLTVTQLREQIGILKALSEALVVETSQGRFPSYSADDYKEALNILIENKLLTGKEAEKGIFGFTHTLDKVVSLAVFKSMHEVAQEKASPKYKDPARTNYIDRKYSDWVTSWVITAYIQTIEIFTY